MRAEDDQVVQIGRAAVGPVPDVVRVEPAGVRAHGEGAAVVARTQGPADGGRHAAPAAPDRQRCAAAFEMHDDAGVAAEPTCGLDRDRDVALDRAGSGGPGRPVPVRGGAEELGVDVHDDRVTVRGGPTADARHQDRVGHSHEPVGAKVRRRRLTAVPLGAERFAGEVQGPLQHGGVLRGEAPADRDGAVVRRIEHEEPLVVRRLRLLTPDAPRRADHALQLRSRVHARELDERVLVLDRTQPGDRADLGVGELPPANAAWITGMVDRQRATRTCSRAALGAIEHRQPSQWAHDWQPHSAQARRSSNCATSDSHRAIAALRWAASVVISSASRSSLSVGSTVSRPVPCTNICSHRLRTEPRSRMARPRSRGASQWKRLPSPTTASSR